MTTFDITMRHDTLPNDLQEHVEEKLQRMDKHFRGREPRIEFILDRDRDNYCCEMIVHDAAGGAAPIVSRTVAAEPRVCVDQAMEKAKAQLIKLNSRRRDHHRGQRPGDGAPASSHSDEERDEPSYDEIVNREIKGE